MDSEIENLHSKFKKTTVNFHRAIYDRIDNNKDGFVSETELKNWIKYVQDQYITKDTHKQWEEFGLGDSDLLTLEAFMERTYGSISEDYGNCISVLAVFSFLGGSRYFWTQEYAIM